jgi:hypothetical protein
MIQALSTNRSYDTFDVGILPGRARCRGNFIEPDRITETKEYKNNDSHLVIYER